MTDPHTTGKSADMAPPSDPASRGDVARHFTAQAPQGRQSEFFQSTALPAALVAAFYHAGWSRAAMRRFAHWRLEYPADVAPSGSEQHLGILAHAEDLLLRGALPLCLPELDDVAQVADEGVASWISAAEFVSGHPWAPARANVFDSPEERELADMIAAELAAVGCSVWTISQVHIASLVARPSDHSNRRCDLLISTRGGTPWVVEVDGAQHESHSESDAARDAELAAVGIEVVRVPAVEVRSGGPRLESLQQRLRRLPHGVRSEPEGVPLLRRHRALHQLHVAIVRALRSGRLGFHAPWAVRVVNAPWADPEVGVAAVEALRILLARLAVVHGVQTAVPEMHVAHGESTDAPTSGVTIAFAGAVDALQPQVFLISDSPLHCELAPPLGAAPAAATVTGGMSEEVAAWFLRYLFRKDEFWEGQWVTVQRTLAGQDTLVLLPTGGGKSIAYQLAALLRPGRCVVVDPIISLMDDQVENLGSVGIDRCAVLSGRLSAEQRQRCLDSLGNGHYHFCFASPERFQSESFREALRSLTAHMPVSAVVVDEAHCVSEWGHDFRTAYLSLGRIAREYCAADGETPPLLALTGTASRIVLKDVQRSLGIESPDAVVTPTSFDRPELRFHVLECRSAEKGARLHGFLTSLPARFGLSRGAFFSPRGRDSTTGIVFCPHVNGPYGVVQQADQLSGSLGTEVLAYSGSPPTGQSASEWEERKSLTARRFKRNRNTVLVATKAFGMGIDKPNIRYSTHLGLPQSIEAFYQEAGRAGRDRQRAECALILSVDDPRRAEVLLSPATSLSEVSRIVAEASWDESDDVVRALYFHVRSFRGVDDELRDLRSLLSLLEPIDRRHSDTLTWESDTNMRSVERGLHRLVVLGVVSDYSVDWSRQEFRVQVAGAGRGEIAENLAAYGRAYQVRRASSLREAAARLSDRPFGEYVLGAGRALIEFVYETVELARRRACREMLLAARDAATSDGEALRARLLDYLQKTEWDERLDATVAKEDAGLSEVPRIIDDVITSRDAAELRAASGRLLESYPDLPSLLFVRGYAEGLAERPNRAAIAQDVVAACRYAAEPYRLEPIAVAETIRALVECGGRVRWFPEVIVSSALESEALGRAALRSLCESLPYDLAGAVATEVVHVTAAVLIPTLTGDRGMP